MMKIGATKTMASSALAKFTMAGWKITAAARMRILPEIVFILILIEATGSALSPRGQPSRKSSNHSSPSTTQSFLVLAYLCRIVHEVPWQVHKALANPAAVPGETDSTPGRLSQVSLIGPNQLPLDLRNGFSRQPRGAATSYL